MVPRFTVALIGPDGSGKSTISERLEEASSIPIKRIYMGINPEAGNIQLPTTILLNRLKRLLKIPSRQGGPRDPATLHPKKSKNLVKRWLKTAKSIILFANRVADEWYRQSVAWYLKRRGYIVIFDRHYYIDYYSYDIDNRVEHRSLLRRLHGSMLEKLYPKPDLVIYLDAPAELLLKRKGEGTIEILEERRQAYLQMREIMPNFRTVDATQPLDVVLANVHQEITDYQELLQTPVEKNQ